MAVFLDATSARGLRLETYVLEFFLHIAFFLAGTSDPEKSYVSTRNFNRFQAAPL